jgi:uncharacterized protein (TIGR02145 family)
MKTRIKIYVLLLALYTVACKPYDSVIPEAETYTPRFIASNDATIGVRALPDDNLRLIASGVYIGLAPNPDVNGYKIQMGTDTGLVLGRITGLTANTKYYVKGYAINPDGEGKGQEVSFTTPPTVFDADNHEYPTVKIDTRVWMAKNLFATHYFNGDPIPSTTVSGQDISGETSPVYLWSYGGDYANTLIYGNLYTWHAATDARKLCPTGWHIPTDAEWTELENTLGGYTTAGKRLKEDGNTHWLNSYNRDATNESCFTGLPGGYREPAGSFVLLQNEGRWWSSTESETASAWARTLNATGPTVARPGIDKKAGLSVRCIKDN